MICGACNQEIDASAVTWHLDEKCKVAPKYVVRAMKLLMNDDGSIGFSAAVHREIVAPGESVYVTTDGHEFYIVEISSVWNGPDYQAVIGRLRGKRTDI
jgi:hypothetical protein